MPNEHAKAQRRSSRGLWLTDAGFRGRLRTLPAYHWSTPPCEGEGWRKGQEEGLLGGGGQVGVQYRLVERAVESVGGGAVEPG